MDKDARLELEESASLVLSSMESGKFRRFQLDNVTYTPHRKIVDKLFKHFGEDTLRKDGTHFLSPHTPFAHTDVEGEFLFLREGEKPNYRGILYIKRTINPRHPLINISLISERALFPHYHQIERIARADSAPSFYTVDEDGSGWSLHCK